jgi:hypothetical protein
MTQGLWAAATPKKPVYSSCHFGRRGVERDIMVEKPQRTHRQFFSAPSLAGRERGKGQAEL